MKDDCSLKFWSPTERPFIGFRTRATVLDAADIESPCMVSAEDRLWICPQN